MPKSLCSHLTLVHLALLSLVQCAQAQDTTAVQITASQPIRVPTPTLFVVPDSLKEGSLLQLKLGDRVLPVQWLDSAQRIAAVLLPAGSPAIGNYKIATQSKGLTLADQVTVVTDNSDENLIIQVGSKHVMTYAISTREPPEGIETLYARSGFVHPLNTPEGATVTDDFPIDHPHQHGLFNAWVNTTFEGHKVDFWNQPSKTGKIGHVRVLSTKSGPVFGEFVVELLHSDITSPDSPKPVLKEIWTVRIWNVSDGFLFDIASVQTCIADSALTINEYHYGGMGFRGRADWLGQEGSDFSTSEGKSRTDGNHTRPLWAAAYGLVNGQTRYIAIMGHPSNFRHPEPVRLHPEMPYFVFTPPPLGPFEISPQETFTSRYRYYVNDGPVDSPLVDQVWAAYSHPPVATVLHE